MARSPKSWNKFIGQRRPIKRLESLSAGAKRLGDPVPHLRLRGRPGLGKTALMESFAVHHGSNIVSLVAEPTVDNAKLFSGLEQLNAGDVFLIDEGHALKPSVQESLLPVLDNYQVLRRIQTGGEADKVWLNFPPFTLVIATWRPSRIIAPLWKRMLDIPLEPYTLAELRAIAKQAADERGMQLTGQAASRIAKIAASLRGDPSPKTRTNGTPRAVRSLVGEMAVHLAGQVVIGNEQIEKCMGLLGIDELGLGPDHRQYLHVLSACGGPIGASHLAGILGLTANDLAEIEQFLFFEGFITMRAGKGRELTAKGRAATTEGSSGHDQTGELETDEASIEEMP